MRSDLHVVSINTITALQRLFAMQEYSLAKYAAHAGLYAKNEPYPYLRTIKEIARDQSLRASAIGSLLISRRVAVEHPGFPLHFTGLNDVSTDYVLRLLFARQPQLVAEIQSWMPSFRADPEARHIAREVWAGESANLNTLTRIAGDTSTAVDDLLLAA